MNLTFKLLYILNNNLNMAHSYSKMFFYKTELLNNHNDNEYVCKDTDFKRQVNTEYGAKKFIKP